MVARLIYKESPKIYFGKPKPLEKLGLLSENKKFGERFFLLLQGGLAVINQEKTLDHPALFKQGPKIEQHETFFACSFVRPLAQWQQYGCHYSGNQHWGREYPWSVP